MERSAEASVLRRRKPIRPLKDPAKSAEGVREDDLHGAFDGLGILPRARAEQRLTDNGIGQPHHFRGHVHRFSTRRALTPLLEHCRRRRFHLVREAGNIVMVKGRLQQAAIALPEFPVAGEQTRTRCGEDRGIRVNKIIRAKKSRLIDEYTQARKSA